MEALLGFKIDMWDYLTFLTLLLCTAALVTAWIWLAGLPGRIAIERKHPDAEAVKLLGYAGLLPTIYPWVQAFVWAFKPTDKIDIRRFPAEEARANEEEMARLRGFSEKDVNKAGDPVEPAVGTDQKKEGEAAPTPEGDQQ
jgi:hypothetical protein